MTGPQDTSGQNCVVPLNPYQKLASGVIVPFIFLGELFVTMVSLPCEFDCHPFDLVNLPALNLLSAMPVEPNSHPAWLSLGLFAS